MTTQLRLAARLRDETQALHRVAEHSGIMRELLHGRLDRRAYCLLLRNLHALYVALEGAMDRHAMATLVSPIRFPPLFRASALREDLEHLHGGDWAALALVDATRAYVERLQQIADEQPVLLVAHAYVRYMGDLSGGQLLRDIVRRSYALDDAGIAFYRFPANIDAQTAKWQFRAAIDALPVDPPTARDIVEESKSAFARHARLFEELVAVPDATVARAAVRRYKPSPP